MALNLDFYKEIIEKEKTWSTNLEYNLLNAYYLPELRDFYISKQDQLSMEAMKTGNALINGLSNTLLNMILKLNFYIESHENGNEIDLRELNNYFLINVLSNNFIETKKIDNEINKLGEIETHKSSLYELRQKITDLYTEDYTDDDFYYNSKAV